MLAPTKPTSIRAVKPAPTERAVGGVSTPRTQQSLRSQACAYGTCCRRGLDPACDGRATVYGPKFVPQLALIDGRAVAHWSALMSVPAVVAAPVKPRLARINTSHSLDAVNNVSPSMSKLQAAVEMPTML